ncbi:MULTISPECIES: hypothetical protein [unclassified Mesorhizobium]|uniref:hypothetical protein n=1 Tax=unclassified Mesorhizobium TaxID=325217 RepID=UPI0012EB8ABF|nr:MULTISPECIES: hypothetical protein [unclassified Mesorhizobium]
MLFDLREPRWASIGLATQEAIHPPLLTWHLDQYTAQFRRRELKLATRVSLDWDAEKLTDFNAERKFRCGSVGDHRLRVDTPMVRLVSSSSISSTDN